MNLKRCSCGAKAEAWQDVRTLKAGVQCDADDCTMSCEFTAESEDALDDALAAAVENWNRRFNRRRGYRTYGAPAAP